MPSNIQFSDLTKPNPLSRQSSSNKGENSANPRSSNDNVSMKKSSSGAKAAVYE